MTEIEEEELTADQTEAKGLIEFLVAENVSLSDFEDQLTQALIAARYAGAKSMRNRAAMLVRGERVRALRMEADWIREQRQAALAGNEYALNRLLNRAWQAGLAVSAQDQKAEE